MSEEERRSGGTVGPDGSPATEELSCEEAVRSVYEYLDGELPSDHAERVRRHVEICRRCYPYFNFERAFLDYVQDRGLKPSRSRALEERLRRLLEEIDAHEA